jgi:hypothetical protein
LHEPFPDSEIGHDFFVIALQKKTTLVPEDLGFEKQDSGKWGGGRFHEIGSIDSKNVMIEIQGQVTAIMLMRLGGNSRPSARSGQVSTTGQKPAIILNQQ